MAIYIQYIGADRVIEAFNSMGIPFWSLAPGLKTGEIFCSNGEIEDLEESSELLEQALNRIHQDPKSSYKLKVYKKVPESGIKDKTEPDATIYFSLCEDPKNSTEYIEYKEADKARRQNNWDALFSRISAIEEKLMQEQEEEEEEESENNLGSVINGLLSSPEIKGVIYSWVGSMMNKKPAIAGINTDNSGLENSLEILKKADPNLESDLKLLAELAQKDPGQFNFLLTLLRK